MNYKEFRYNSESEYFNDFYKTSLNSNRTADFFVNWQKVYTNAQKFLDEIALLNGLVNITDMKRRRKHLFEILKKYPKTRLVLPLIIATRDQQINILRIGKAHDLSSKNVDFNKSSITELLEFCDETKIIELFGKIKDLYSYITGVEVGSDTNARKNRSGTIFEDIVINSLKKAGINARKADKKFQLGGRLKKPDIIISKNKKDFAIIEVNFFHELGSKPLETAQSYIQLQNDAKKAGVKFIWITDGPAWKTGKKERKSAFRQMDYIFNLNLAVKLIPKMLI